MTTIRLRDCGPYGAFTPWGEDPIDQKFASIILAGQRCSSQWQKDQPRSAGIVIMGVENPANSASDSRCVRCWTQEQISFLSDVIASATLLETERLGRMEGFEQWEAVGVRAVEMTFSVSHTFKGNVPPDGKIVVRYYETPGTQSLESSLEADALGTQSYLLYLLQEANNRFAPTSGLMESRMCIRPQGRKEPGVSNTPGATEISNPVPAPLAKEREQTCSQRSAAH